MRIGFGVNFMPSAPVLEVVEWAKAVECHGYDLLGISDSQERSRVEDWRGAPQAPLGCIRRFQLRARVGSP